jgi:hypothetical protein
MNKPPSETNNDNGSFANEWIQFSRSKESNFRAVFSANLWSSSPSYQFTIPDKIEIIILFETARPVQSGISVEQNFTKVQHDNLFGECVD